MFLPRLYAMCVVSSRKIIHLEQNRTTTNKVIDYFYLDQINLY